MPSQEQVGRRPTRGALKTLLAKLAPQPIDAELLWRGSFDLVPQGRQQPAILGERHPWLWRRSLGLLCQRVEALHRDAKRTADVSRLLTPLHQAESTPLFLQLLHLPPTELGLNLLSSQPFASESERRISE